MSPAEFCEQHRACEDVRAWAIATGCATMAELWARDDLRIDWRIWIFSKSATAREVRLFACFCARRVAHLNPDPRVAAAIDAAERYTRGEASEQDLAAAWAAARAAARDAASDAWAAAETDWADWADWAAAWAAARAAAMDPWAATRDAANAAGSAAGSPAWYAAGAAANAAWDDAIAAEQKAQSDYLRRMPNPFDVATHA